MSRRLTYESLARRMLRDIRAKRTQVEMSRILGFSDVHWHRWETGQRVIKWPEFHELCRKTAIQLDEVVRAICGPSKIDVSSGKELFEELRVKFGGLSARDLSKCLSLSQQKIHRIQSGAQEVELWVILEMLGELGRLLPLFLESMCPAVPVQGREGDARRYATQRRLEATHPWLCVLEALIEHHEYQALKKHQDGFFVKKTGIPLKVVRASLGALSHNGAICWVNGKYRLNLKRVDMEHMNPVESAALARFWTRKALQRFDTRDGVPPSKRGWTYRIFPVSNSIREEINREVQRFYGRINELFEKDRDNAKDGAQVLLLHYFDVEELREVSGFSCLAGK